MNATVSPRELTQADNGNDTLAAALNRLATAQADVAQAKLAIMRGELAKIGPLPAYGEQIEGGRFHGIVLLDGRIWGEVTAPKVLEISGLVWHPKYTEIAGATSNFDGLANTLAMAEAGSPIALALRELRHEGHDDWYLAARGGQLMQWANLQPVLPDAEKFDPVAYWNSTQFSRYDAYGQYFDDGNTNYCNKSWDGGRASPVRRFLIG